MKPRWGVLLLPLVLASLMLLGVGCSLDEVELRLEPPGEVPAFAYELYCDGQGRFTYDGAALKLVRRPAHLERVYADAGRGDARAKELVHELEAMFAAAGVEVANTTTRLACLPLPELTPDCQPNWQFMNPLGTTPGAQRLREVVADAFAARARERGLKNRVIAEAVNLLLARGMAKGLVAKEAAAEARAAAPATEAAAGLPDNVIPLDRARAARKAAPPEAPPMPARAEPLKATGTDGPVPRRQPAPTAPPREVPSTTEAPAPKPKTGREGPGRASPIVVAVTGGLDSLVDEASGDTREVLEAKLAAEEDAAPGARLPWDLEAVRKAQPVLERPPPGVHPDTPRWREYIRYYGKRLGEMEAASAAGKPKSVKPPREWASYQVMRDNFARGIAFQRAQVAKLPELAKRLGFSKPVIRMNAGVKKADVRYADALIIETDPTRPARIEAVSFKSRNLGGMEPRAVEKLFEADAADAHRYYGGDLDIRTPALRELGYKNVRVEKVHLIYDGDSNLLGGHGRDALGKTMKRVGDRTGVEVRLQ